MDIEAIRNLIEDEARTRGASELRVNVFSGDQFLKTLTSSDRFVAISTQMWLHDNPANGLDDLNPAFDEALIESREEMAKLLPDGLMSEDQFIFVAELENVRIGTAWAET